MNYTKEQIAKAVELVRRNHGRREIAKALSVTSHKARALVEIAHTLIAYGGKNEPLSPSEPLFRLRLLRELQRPVPPESLALKLGISVDDLNTAMMDLEESGYMIVRHGSRVSLSSSTTPGGPRINLTTQFGKTTRFGFVTDTHLANKHCRLDVLEAAYDIFAREKIATVLHAGNLVDGEARFNKHELLAHGVADQMKFVLDHYPQRKGITTYYIDGDDHEGWWRQREGVEFGKMLELFSHEFSRQDLKYMGYVENDVELAVEGGGSAILRVMHPGGGSAYAYSYTSQKIVESFQGGEKPAILLCGHYHKMDLCYPRGVHVIQGGCVCDQTTFMRKNKLEAHVGFWILELQQDKAGAVSRLTSSWYPFYDRGYHMKVAVPM